MLSPSQKSSKRKKRGCFGEDSENTPNELIYQWSPPHKHPRVISKGKENEGDQFVLARRSRRTKESTSGTMWASTDDQLPVNVTVFKSFAENTLPPMLCLFILGVCVFTWQASRGTVFLRSCFWGSSSASRYRSLSGCPGFASAGIA